jgi:hypothetical protein
LAYLRYGMGDADASITNILTRLDWDSLGSASVAEVRPLGSFLVTLRCAVFRFVTVNY